MARTAQIHYHLITFSLPEETVQKLQKKVPKNERSKFVAEAINEHLEKERFWTGEDIEAYFKEYAKEVQVLPGPSAVELVRAFRYGKPRWEK